MAPITEWIPLASIQATGWALVHFLWQGTLLAVVVATLMALPLFRTASMRYGVCLASLLVMVALPLFTGLAVYEPTTSISPVIAKPIETPPAPKTQAHDHVGPTRANDVALPPSPLREFTPATATRIETLALSQRWDQLRERIAPFIPWGVAFWLGGLLLLSGHNLMAWLNLQRFRTRGVKAVAPHIESIATRVGVALGITRTVQCLETMHLAVPGTFGWLKPVILLPTSTLLGLSPEQLEAVIAHEMAHIRRHDYLINLIQTAAETLLFYHPAVWWLSRRIRLERELCCDAVAVAYCNDTVAYAETLLRIETLQRTPRMAMAATDGSLLTRIRHLADSTTVRRATPSRNGWLGSVVALGTIAAFVAPSVTPLFAQSNQQAPEARSITFPEWTMGQLMVRPWGSGLQENWEPFQPAMGTVNVPAGVEVQLVIDNNAVNDLSPLGYLGVQDLQSINFRRTEVQDDQLAYIEGMELLELNFELTEITNEAIQYFDDMTSLERLSVGRTNVDNEGVINLGGLTGLRQLDLNLTDVTDEGLAQLENLRNLENLDLWGAEITDESMAWIGTLTQLRVLGLEEARITDAGLALLRNLVNMEDLNLQTTPITDEGLAYLANMHSLTNLNVRNTRITDAMIDFIVDNFDLTHYSMSRQISPELWAKLEGRPRYSVGHNRLSVHIRDGASGAAIADAKMEINWRDQGNTTYTPHYFWSDESGDTFFYVDFDHTADVSVYAEGYVPTTVVWETGQSDEITVKLDRARTIGGSVVDESGVVVEGVALRLSLPGERDYDRDTLPSHLELSEKDGRWTCLHAPSDLSTFSITLTHPDYIETQYTPEDLSAGRLKAMSERLVIRRGFDVTGVVSAEDGSPIAGATLTELEPRAHEMAAATTNTARTNADGVFLFANQKTGPIKLKINAGGYLPLIEDAVFENPNEPLAFTLRPGMIFQGTVVDPSKKPLEGVRIEIPEDIGRGSTNHVGLSWKTITDKEGRFYWDEAPEEPFTLSFSKRGFAPLVKQVTATNEEVVIVMGPPVTLSGTILDERGEPQKEPVLATVRAVSDSEANHESRTMMGLGWGDYHLDLTSIFSGLPIEYYQVTIQAPGYQDEVSRNILANEGDISMDFTMRPLPKITGVVQAGNEDPVEGATVYAVHHPWRGAFRNNLPVDGISMDATAISTTSAEGQFTVTAPDAQFSLIVFSPEGYALTDPLTIEDAPLTVPLLPWGALSLTEKRGTHPEANVEVSAVLNWQISYADSGPPYQLQYAGETNREGQLQFDHLVPGYYYVDRRMAHLTDTGQSTTIRVKPGATTSFELGGWGKPVIGSIEIPEDKTALIDWERCKVLLQNVIPAKRLPDGFSEWTKAAQAVWHEEAWEAKVDPSKPEERWPAFNYQTGLKDKKHFRFEDVVPGDYGVMIQFFRKPENGSGLNEELARIEQRYRLEPFEGGRIDTPHDLGLLIPVVSEK